MTILAHRIRLDPNNAQRTFLERCAGTDRFAYNWGLAEWKRQYEAGGRPSWQSLNTELNRVKGAEFPWMKELPWKVPNTALSDLGRAFSNFFAQRAHYPRFKKKGRCREGFAIEARNLRFRAQKIKIPKLGWVRIREPLRFPGRILSARFSKRAGHWYLSVQVEIDESQWSYPHRCETQTACVGVDWGIIDLATLSNGERVPAPRILRKLEARQRMLNKELHRRKKGGRNRAKTKLKLQRLYERMANVRQDVVHKLTSDLVKRFRFIGIEHLNVKGMTQNRRLAKSILDAAPAELRRQLEYKAPLAGATVVEADPFFPSSKTCHACGLVNKDLGLERVWTCEGCRTEHNRDVNAGKNLENMAAAHAAAACRQGSSGLTRKSKTKLPLGQEPGSYVFT